MTALHVSKVAADAVRAATKEQKRIHHLIHLNPVRSTCDYL
jgi:hypothetical protein